MKKIQGEPMHQSAKGIDFIICGLEHSGTTVLSDIFRQHPGCNSGWEVGVLLNETPRKFPLTEPFFNNMIKGWGIEQGELKKACNTDDFNQFYDSIYKNSTTKEIPISSIRFDKTPRYITRVRQICSAIQVPILSVIRDPRSLAASDFRRSKVPEHLAHDWYKEWMPKKLRYMQKAYQGYLYSWENPQCMVIRHEDLCLETRNTLEKAFDHVGLKAKLDYLEFPSKRTVHTIGTTLNPALTLSFKKILSPDLCSRIENDFARLEKWFYDYS